MKSEQRKWKLMSKITEIRFAKTRTYIGDWRRKTEWEKGCTEKIKKKQTQTELEDNRRKERERKQRHWESIKVYVYARGGKSEIT